MKRLTANKIVVVAAVALLAAGALMAQSSDPVVSKANQFVTALQKGDYSAAYQLVDSNLGFKITPEKLGSVWQNLVSRAGSLKELKRSTVENKNGYFIVTTVAKFEKGHVDILVALDNMMRVADFQFKNHKDEAGKAQMQKPAEESTAPAPSAEGAP